MRKTRTVPEAAVAYLSMEIAIVDEIPTFSGGLGVLAGDYLRSMADLEMPLVAVTLMYRGGFFRQEIDAGGHQLEFPVEWNPEEHLERLDTTITVELAGRSVEVGVWRYLLAGCSGAMVPIYLLDTDVGANAPLDREITARLYAGGRAERLAQEIVLGVGGLHALRALGHLSISSFHMNEGHAALLPLALLEERGVLATDDDVALDLKAVRAACVFTTHTPVPAGHDRFERPLVDQMLGAVRVAEMEALSCFENDELNMTLLGMALSGFINGVAFRHGEVSRTMFPQFRIEAITNGVHVGRWADPAISAMFDAYLPDWREDNTMLRYASRIPIAAIRDARNAAKAALVDEVQRRSGVELDASILTLGIARRATGYKRNDLLLQDVEALRALVSRAGPLQVVYSGKAHPSDTEGKGLIAHVAHLAKELSGAVRVVYLPDYGMNLAARLVAGVDVWLNTPIARHEASGTSGMKAALNGVPSLSVVDGWWVEGCVEGVTGWAVGADAGPGGGEALDRDALDTADREELHRVIGDVIAPLYYGDPDAFAAVGRAAIALNGSFFNTHRMATEYVLRAYRGAVRLNA